MSTVVWWEGNAIVDMSELVTILSLPDEDINIDCGS